MNQDYELFLTGPYGSRIVKNVLFHDDPRTGYYTFTRFVDRVEVTVFKISKFSVHYLVNLSQTEETDGQEDSGNNEVDSTQLPD